MWWIPFIVVGVLVALIVIPIAFIWAINELFKLNIVYNIYTWFAALIILGVLHGGRGMKHWNKKE